MTNVIDYKEKLQEAEALLQETITADTTECNVDLVRLTRRIASLKRWRRSSMETLKIALCGGMRSGKDTVGKYLRDHYAFERVAFGDAIREVCAVLYPDQVKNGAKPRHLYQGVGQDLRKYDEYVWIKAAFSAIQFYESENVVVTDLRQPNEYIALKEAGFKIIRVNASRATRIERMTAAGDDFKPEDLVHDTERHYPHFEVDHVLTNDGDLNDLHQQIDAMIAKFTGGAVDGRG